MESIEVAKNFDVGLLDDVLGVDVPAEIGGNPPMHVVAKGIVGQS